jgi:rhomboid family GlyGly-CTERM serine protease
MRVPIVSVAIGVLAAVVCGVPVVQAWLVYDRAAILGGELWRLFTWPLVHFGGPHFTYDVLAFGIAGALAEARGIRRFGLFCSVTTMFTGVAILLTEPELRFCGGLSALAMMATVLLCLEGLNERGPWGWICRMGLVMALSKIVAENVAGTSLFLGEQDSSLVIVPGCHVMGAAMAVLFRVLGADQRLVSGCGTSRTSQSSVRKSWELPRSEVLTADQRAIKD